MNPRRSGIGCKPAGIVALSIALLALAVVAIVPADSGARAPRAGKYSGTVGTTARIFFTVRGTRVTKVNAGVNTLCQDTFGTLTRMQLVAVDLGRKSFKIKRRKFTAKGQTEDGVRYDLRGRFSSRNKAKGTFEGSLFRLLPAFNSSELCASKQEWTAKRGG